MDARSLSIRTPGLVSLSALSPLVKSISPNPSILIQYPLFFTMARVTVHRKLGLRSDGRQMSSIQASCLHGIDVYNKYGIFALYRGIHIHMSHSFANALLSHSIKRVKSSRIASTLRVAADALTYPLLLACTRMVAYTTGDSSWGFMDCIRNTLEVDGIWGLWAGSLPFLMVSVYKEAEEAVFKSLKKSYAKLDEADIAILGFLRVGFGAVLTSPFLTMSTILRCQSNNPDLLKPTSFGEVFRNMPWKWNLVALSLVTTLGAVNLALIHEKYTAEEDELQEPIDTVNSNES
jgi:hypothetical protein